MKRLVVCCDGTWQKLDNPCPTNAIKIAQAIASQGRDGTPQTVYYSAGIGSDGKGLEKLSAGAFGQGISQDIQEAYLFLSLNYTPGDRVYLFGFSRGAYTVRSLAGMIYCSGLLTRSQMTRVGDAYHLYRDREIKPRDPRAVNFRQTFGDRIPITVLGCWDTVGALGIPDLSWLFSFNDLYNRRYRFHDTTLNRCIQNAFHAVAIDERSKVFNVTPMRKNPDVPRQNLRQVWFPGTHGCVGGGTEAWQGLSDRTLKWMIDSVESVEGDLEFDITAIQGGLSFDPLTNFAQAHWIQKLAQLGGRIWRDVSDDFADLDASVSQRWKNMAYRPQNLQKFLDLLEK